MLRIPTSLKQRLALIQSLRLQVKYTCRWSVYVTQSDWARDNISGSLLQLNTERHLWMLDVYSRRKSQDPTTGITAWPQFGFLRTACWTLRRIQIEELTIVTSAAGVAVKPRNLGFFSTGNMFRTSCVKQRAVHYESITFDNMVWFVLPSCGKDSQSHHLRCL